MGSRAGEGPRQESQEYHGRGVESGRHKHKQRHKEPAERVSEQEMMMVTYYRHHNTIEYARSTGDTSLVPKIIETMK